MLAFASLWLLSTRVFRTRPVGRTLGALEARQVRTCRAVVRTCRAGARWLLSARGQEPRAQRSGGEKGERGVPPCLAPRGEFLG